MPIYLRDPEGGLVRMDAEPYGSEDVLQRLLEEFPELLTGDDSDGRRPWLLVAREMPTPADEGLGGRWSLDHLFLDPEGVPTLVEVKRSSDTRIRREVVGQMLDYAANAVVYWPVEHLQVRFAATCEKAGVDPDTVLDKFLPAEIDAEGFWDQVATNLRAGVIRMVFVADAIPRELQRVVEFLNEQMDPAEVFAIEVQQYVGGNQQTLVPRTIGRTAAAESAKRRPSVSKSWDQPSFLADVQQRMGADVAEAVERLIQWGLEHGASLRWGTGATHGAMQLHWPHPKGSAWPVTVRSNGRIEVPLGSIAVREPFDDPTLLREYVERLNAFPGADLPNDEPGGWPSFPFDAIATDRGYEALIDALTWFRTRLS